LDGTATDRAVIEHIKLLATLLHSEVVLLHVADGWAARMFGPDAISPEVAEDQAYLEKVRIEFQKAGLRATVELAYGQPGDEIIKWAAGKHCDLIAMTSHGHKLIGDLLHGSTIDKVRHNTQVPLLVVRAATSGPADPP
jgi:manganese transport protein